jgi:predicted transcriptional regulator of viral defense system
MKHEKFFRQRRVFRREEFEEYLGSLGAYGERTAERVLAYHRSTGRLISIRRGLYAMCDPPAAAGQPCSVDPFLIAGRVVADAVLTHDTALQFFGRSYAIRSVYLYASSRPLPAFPFRRQRFRGTSFPAALVREGESDFAVVRAERLGVELRVTSLERTLVDVLDRLHVSAGWEEGWRSLESVEYFDLDTVVAYTSLLGNATTAAKVGFYLEQHREALMVEDAHLRSLRELRPRQPHYFFPDARGGRLVKDWNLVVPQEVIDRSWEEIE